MISPGWREAKLAVAAVVGPEGLLVLNADDAQLRAQADGLARRFGRCPPLGWFCRRCRQTRAARISACAASRPAACAADGCRLSHEARSTISGRSPRCP